MATFDSFAGDPFGRGEYLLYGRPIRVRWAGWESDTRTLQRAGWKISAHQDICSRTIQFAIRHDEWGARGISTMCEEMAYDPRQIEFGACMDVGFRLGKDVVLHNHGPVSQFLPIDAEPRLMHTEGRTMRLEDFAWFAPSPNAGSKKIIVPEPDVAQLLDQILKLQEPEQQALYEERYWREKKSQQDGGALIGPSEKVACQILTLPHAA